MTCSVLRWSIIPQCYFLLLTALPSLKCLSLLQVGCEVSTLSMLHRFQGLTSLYFTIADSNAESTSATGLVGLGDTIANMISSLPVLERLNINTSSMNIASDIPWQSTSLQKISISPLHLMEAKNDEDDDEQKKDIPCGNLIFNTPNLTSLAMEEEGPVSDTSIPPIILSKMIDSCTSLVRLKLSAPPNMSTLCSFQHLVSLNIGPYGFITPLQMALILETPHLCNSITELALTCTGVPSIIITTICYHMKQLTSLFLRHRRLNDEQIGEQPELVDMKPLLALLPLSDDMDHESVYETIEDMKAKANQEAVLHRNADTDDSDDDDNNNNNNNADANNNNENNATTNGANNTLNDTGNSDINNNNGDEEKKTANTDDGPTELQRILTLFGLPPAQEKLVNGEETKNSNSNTNNNDEEAKKDNNNDNANGSGEATPQGETNRILTFFGLNPPATDGEEKKVDGDRNNDSAVGDDIEKKETKSSVVNQSPETQRITDEKRNGVVHLETKSDRNESNDEKHKGEAKEQKWSASSSPSSSTTNKPQEKQQRKQNHKDKIKSGKLRQLRHDKLLTLNVITRGDGDTIQWLYQWSFPNLTAFQWSVQHVWDGEGHTRDDPLFENNATLAILSFLAHHRETIRELSLINDMTLTSSHELTIDSNTFPIPDLPSLPEIQPPFEMPSLLELAIHATWVSATAPQKNTAIVIY
jgi:hypothetical protein